jgi:hypothetical protein
MLPKDTHIIAVKNYIDMTIIFFNRRPKVSKVGKKSDFLYFIIFCCVIFRIPAIQCVKQGQLIKISFPNPKILSTVKITGPYCISVINQRPLVQRGYFSEYLTFGIQYTVTYKVWCQCIYSMDITFFWESSAPGDSGSR